MKYIIHIGVGVGDFAMSLPVMKAIKNYDKDAYISLFMAGGKKAVNRVMPLFKYQNMANDIVGYSKRNIAFSCKNLIKCMHRKYDYGFTAIGADGADASPWPSFFLNKCCRVVIGHEVKNNPNIHLDVVVPRIKNRNALETMQCLLQEVSKDILLDYDNVFDCNILEKCYMDTGISICENRAIFLCVGAVPVCTKVKGKKYSKPLKNWPYINWVSLANKLVNDGYDVYLLGTSAERVQIECCGSELNTKVQNLCGLFSVDKSISLLKYATLIIGSDTGLMHWAGLMDRKLLTLFGPTSETQYLAKGKNSYAISKLPECAPCFATEKAAICESYECMKNITVESVYYKSIEIMNKENNENYINE